MKILFRVVSCIFSFCISLNTFAALYDKSNGLIYDDVLDITWLQDANYAQTSAYDSDGRMTWSQANAWADQLSYGGYDDWRLPSAKLMNPTTTPCYAYDGSCDTGSNNTTSELGHMFYNNLGNLGRYDTNGNYQPGFGVRNSSFTDGNSGASVSIVNLQNSYYRFGEEYEPDTYYAWAFGTGTGGQDYDIKDGNYYSWAVHDGDIGASPVPLPAGIYLFLSGLVGLGLVKSKKKVSLN